MCRSVFSNVGFVRGEPGLFAQKVKETDRFILYLREGFVFQ